MENKTQIGKSCWKCGKNERKANTQTDSDRHEKLSRKRVRGGSVKPHRAINNMKHLVPNAHTHRRDLGQARVKVLAKLRDEAKQMCRKAGEKVEEAWSERGWGRGGVGSVHSKKNCLRKTTAKHIYTLMHAWQVTQVSLRLYMYLYLYLCICIYASVWLWLWQSDIKTPHRMESKFPFYLQLMWHWRNAAKLLRQTPATPTAPPGPAWPINTQTLPPAAVYNNFFFFYVIFKVSRPSSIENSRSRTWKVACGKFGPRGWVFVERATRVLRTDGAGRRAAWPRRSCWLWWLLQLRLRSESDRQPRTGSRSCRSGRREGPQPFCCRVECFMRTFDLGVWVRLELRLRRWSEFTAIEVYLWPAAFG